MIVAFTLACYYRVVIKIILEAASFFIAVWTLIISFRVFNSNVKEVIHRSFFILGLLCAFYSFIYGLLFGTIEYERAAILYRISVLSWGILPSAMIMFIYIFSRYINNKKITLKRYLFYLPSVFFVVMGLKGNLLAKDFKPTEYGWRELELFTGFWDWFYVGYLVFTFILCMFLLLKLLLTISNPRQRKLIYIIAIPFLAVVVMALVFNIILNSRSTYAFPAVAHISFGALIIGMGYFMIKFRYFEIVPTLVADDLLDLMTDICIITDKEGHIIKLSHSGLDFWGIREVKTSVSGRDGMNLSEFLHLDFIFPGLGETLHRVIELKRRDGKKITHQCVIKTLSDNFGQILGYFFIAHDAEELIKLEKATGKLKVINNRLKILSETDPLTGLYNRLKLNEIFDREIKKANRYKHKLSIIMFDLDDFKGVNDLHGHNTGDQVLEAVAVKVNSILREFEIFCRWGGEEFIILCPNSDLKGTTSLAWRILSDISEIKVGPVSGITASIGVSELKPGEDKISLISRADKNLYSAKEKGKNIVVSK